MKNNFVTAARATAPNTDSTTSKKRLGNYEKQKDLYSFPLNYSFIISDALHERG